MILANMKCVSGGHRRNVSVKILARELLLGRGNGGLQQRRVADAWIAALVFDSDAVKCEDVVY